MFLIFAQEAENDTAKDTRLRACRLRELHSFLWLVENYPSVVNWIRRASAPETKHFIKTLFCQFVINIEKGKVT